MEIVTVKYIFFVHYYTGTQWCTNTDCIELLDCPFKMRKTITFSQHFIFLQGNLCVANNIFFFLQGLALPFEGVFMVAIHTASF